MNNNQSSSLEELLLLNNFEIISNRMRLTDVVWKYENIKWNDAQRKASFLIKSNTALDYLNAIREKFGIPEHQLSLSVPPETTIPIIETTQPVQVDQPDEKPKQDANMFEENYILLTRFAPELEEELSVLTEKGILSGKSATNLYGSTSIKSVEKDKYGYYLLLEINESAKPEKRILLFVNTTEKTVFVLFCEVNNDQFNVYNDIHTREMMNPHQLELQNEHLNEILKRLISHKLFIPTINIVQVEEPKTEDPEPQKEKTPDETFHELMEMVKYDDEFKGRSNEEYLHELIEENETLTEENEELNERILFLEDTVYRNNFKTNFKLLNMLIPGLSKELNLRSFTVTLQPESPKYTVYKLDFEKVAPRDVICSIYELDPLSNKFNEKCCIHFMDEQEVIFVGNEGEFFGLGKNILIREHFEVSEDSVQANSALHTYFLTLLLHKYHSTISNRVYPVEIVKNAPQKAEIIETTEAIEESQESDATGAVVAVLATIGLGILGFKFLKP